ncbi:FGGY-family carbohydrate kinase [Oryzifoliimicrobium ureilyticus]|uniref:FGGY-family carbohydrate kinase n=1 Tax=Oryzifoliimicrobium ureilyticus TaxID=3113724 RepID=UPI0030762FBD
MAHYLIGLDFGSESARGVLIDVGTGQQVAERICAYKHGIITQSLPDGTSLPPAFFLQDPHDYLQAARDILTTLGEGRIVDGIGIGFTASSPLPARSDGEPLSQFYPSEPHAYVKLWKHNAQIYADRINAQPSPYFQNFGGRVSGEWLLAKAAQIADEAPSVWAETERFIEAGDWLVWQLTGQEARGLGFAAYKAQFSSETGYPEDVVPGLVPRLSRPLAVGSRAGSLTQYWRGMTGIEGDASVAVAVIDSHVMLAAVGAVSQGCFVGALGTSAAYLYLSDAYKPLPPGIEGFAFNGSMRNIWCYEAGQPSFGDTLAWFVRTFPRGADMASSFKRYNEDAASLGPAAGRMVALDWLGGNRVPFADGNLSGLLAGLSRQTTAAEIYQALMESLCFGARMVFDLFPQGGLQPERVLMASGLVRTNPLLIQIMTDVFDRPIEVPEIANITAVGAAIHGAVASGVVVDYVEGAARFGARNLMRFEPRRTSSDIYQSVYAVYRDLAGQQDIHSVMHSLKDLPAV